MPRIPVPRILISISITTALATLAAAQAKTSGELNVVRCWAVGADAPISQIATDGGRLYAGSDGARLRAFTIDGKQVWSAEFGGEIVSNILVGDSSLFLATSAIGGNPASALRLLSRETGIVGGTLPLPAADRHFIARVNGLFAVVSSNGVVQLMDEHGTTMWRREIAAGFAGVPAFAKESLYVASKTQQVFTILLATGEIESVRKMPFNVAAIGASADGVLLVGDERGNLTSLTPDGRTNWRFRSGGRISRISISNGEILALSHDNFVYCIDLSNGGVRWKRRLGGRATHSVTINGTYTLTTSLDEHGAILTDLGNGKPAGQIGLGLDEFISADPVSIGPLVVIGTNAAAYGYSLSGQSGCPK